MARSRFRVNAVAPTEVTTLGPDGKPEKRAGVSVRAHPVVTKESERLLGWHANSPNGWIGFTVYDDSAAAYTVGYEFYVDFLPCGKG